MPCCRADLENLLLKEDGEKLIAFKYVCSSNRRSPYSFYKADPIYYEDGETFSIKADTNTERDCSYGINVATLGWCLENKSSNHAIIVVEFDRKDIACISHYSTGKFRIHKCKVLGLLSKLRKEIKGRY